MARGINKVIILGNVGNEPEIRTLPSGALVANVSIATSESWTDKQTGNKQDKTEWHRVVFFARLAEIVQQYIHKGSQIYIEGRLRTNKWQDQQGNTRYTTEIIASEMQMLGRAADNQGSNYQPNNNSYQSNNFGNNNYGNNYNNNNNQTGAYNQNAGSNFNQPAQQAPEFDANDGGFDNYDDEIPF